MSFKEGINDTWKKKLLCGAEYEKWYKVDNENEIKTAVMRLDWEEQRKYGQKSRGK